MAERAADAPRASFAGAVREHLREIGFPRVLIGLFLVALFGIALATHMNIAGLVTDSLLRIGRNGLLVLALLPAVQGGVGLNFGLPLGVLCGLVGLVTAMNFNCTGWTGIAVGTACDGCPPLPDLMDRYERAGGRYLVCPICVQAKKLDSGNFVANAEVGGTVVLWDWIGDGATTFSY